MLAPAGQATARAGQLCWLAALVARHQAPRTPAAINFRLFVGAAYMRPANLPVYPVSPSPPCRGRACPARSLPPYPFHGQSVGEGFIPPGHLPAAANGHGGQRTGHPTTSLENPCVGRGALTPPKKLPLQPPYPSPTKPTAPSESHFGGGGSLTFIYTLNGDANYSTSCRAA